MQLKTFTKEGKLLQLLSTKWSVTKIFVLVCSILITYVTTNHHVPLMDVAWPSAEHNSAVFSIPVALSTSSEHGLASGYLNSHGIDHNEVTFDLSLGELQRQEKEAIT